MNETFTYFSTFSGVGGFELGIQNIYPKARCVGYSEIDKYAIEIYQSHFTKHTNYGDITTIDEKELPTFDLLVGGFPCQAFSIAGKRRGFDDTRGTLFFDIARIVREKQPRLLLLENVKGLLSHNQGRTFLTIIRTIDELGYDVQWQVLNSKNHRVPQNRERVFIVGHLRGTPRPDVFPFRENGRQDNEVCGRETEIAQTPTCHCAKKISDAQYLVHNVYGGFGEKEPRVFEQLAPTVRASAGGGHLPNVVTKSTIRRLTPTECERLQGFPDEWTEGLSDTQRYKTLGNAVTVTVVSEIVSRLL